MDRVIDAAAVLLLAGATAFVALYARGWFEPREERASAVVEAAPASPPYAVRVIDALPRLEELAAAGSMRDRTLACTEGDAQLERITEIEAEIGSGEDATIAEPLARGLAALRSCVACTPEPRGCAEAARALATLESRLGLPSSAGGI